MGLRLHGMRVETEEVAEKGVDMLNKVRPRAPSGRIVLFANRYCFKQRAAMSSVNQGFSRNLFPDSPGKNQYEVVTK